MEYKIIGGDGVEYGPVDADEIKAWIRDGRVGRQTLVWRSDTNTWLPAPGHAEFVADLTQLYGSTPQAPVFQPAGFWVRLAAHLVDQVLLTFIVVAIWGIFLAQTPGWEFPQFKATNSPAELEALRAGLQTFLNKLMMIFLPLLLLYEVILHGRFGATLGKMVLGLRIVRVDGTPIDYLTAFARWVCERLSEIICYIGYFFVFFRPDKRAMHDLFAGTRVVYRR